MSENSSEKGISTVKVFEMYLEGAKWLLAIIAGMLVYGLDRVTEHPVTGWPLWTFTASSACLGVSAAAALYYLLKSFGYASTAAQAISANAAAVPNNDANNEERSKIPDREQIYNRIKAAFGIMIWFFSIGGALYLMFGLQQILTIKEKPETRIEAGQRDVFLARGERLWVLRSGNKGAIWVRLPDAPRQ